MSSERPEGNWDYSLLHYAAKDKNYQLVKELLTRKDIDVNLQSKAGRTPLMLASGNGSFEIVQELLTRKDIDVNLQTKKGSTALTIATKRGFEKIVEKLQQAALKDSPIT
ncbi:MAG: ankyrin repeat domain-containing protein [Simkaniaceae bacterium]